MPPVAGPAGDELIPEVDTAPGEPGLDVDALVVHATTSRAATANRPITPVTLRFALDSSEVSRCLSSGLAPFRVGVPSTR